MPVALLALLAQQEPQEPQELQAQPGLKEYKVQLA
jgi:hypothetical protein